MQVTLNGLDFVFGRHDYPNGLTRRYFLEVGSHDPEIVGRYADTAKVPYYARRRSIGGPVLAVLDSGRESSYGENVVALQMVTTNTAHIPVDSEYKDALGMGSYLLDRYCADLDLEGLVGLLRVQSMDEHRIDNRGLAEWYESRGFYQLGENIGPYSMRRDPMT